MIEPKKIEIKEMVKFLYMNDKNDEISKKLHDYFTKYYDFCFDLINKNMIKEIDKFRY